MIHLLGMDPSMRNWGLAKAQYDPVLQMITQLDISIVQTKPDASKQVRQRSKDVMAAEQLFTGVLPACTLAQVVFVETPVGSKSARAMASYGLCVGVLGSLQARGIQLIEVTAEEVKVAMTGKKTASKDDMIAAAVQAYPLANWPITKHREGAIAGKAEHMADAIGAIHAGIKLPAFQNLLRLLAATT